MALAKMRERAAEARQKFAVRVAAVVHRLGRLEIGETSVLVVVASAHRAAAFDACRWLIDTLKRTVPIWKKEHFDDGAVWSDGEPFPEQITSSSNQCTGEIRAPAPSAVEGPSSVHKPTTPKGSHSKNSASNRI